jgi:hypothetical protein
VKRDRDVVAIANACITRGDCAAHSPGLDRCTCADDSPIFTTDFAADAALIESFARLTDRFLVPLNRYFNSLLPAATSDLTYAPCRTLTFNQSAFLNSVKTRRNEDGQLQLRRSKASTTSIHHLYERFLRLVVSGHSFAFTLSFNLLKSPSPPPSGVAFSTP